MTDSGEFQPGAMVTPSIRLQRLLGRGGMGSVWIADHLQLRTQVVVKFMAAERAEREDAKQRFRREAELAAQAKNPHVVQIFDHGVSQLGVPYIAMELLEGEDLGKRIARDGAIEAKVFCRWLMQACRGLGRAHAKGIVHRDIKPENIFLCDDEGEVLVKVLDFGVAKELTGPAGLLSTRTGAIMGTTYYMSPEQTMGRKDIDHRSDLWSMAVVSFHALTGVRPFTGDGIGQVVMAITTDALPLPSQHNPALGPKVDAWMTRALSRVPAERFQTARELGRGLAAALDLSESERRESADAWPSQDKRESLGELGSASSSDVLSASTMAPSVHTGPQKAVPAASVKVPRRRGWLVAVLGGAALGVLGVWVLLQSGAAEPAPGAATAAALPVAASIPPVSPAASPSNVAQPMAAPAPAASASSQARSPAAPPSSVALPVRRGPPASGKASSAPAAQPPASPAQPPPQNPLDMVIQ